MTHEMASMAKAWNTAKGREVVALGRELLGGNGIVSDFLVAKSFCDLEAYHTYAPLNLSAASTPSYIHVPEFAVLQDAQGDDQNTIDGCHDAHIRVQTENGLGCRYEGTYEVNVLVAGRGETGLAAFKPPPARRQPAGSLKRH